MENIKKDIYSVFSASKNPLIERFNRVLTNKLWKQFTINGNLKWLKILQPTVDKYSNYFHRTISTTSEKASKDPSLVRVSSQFTIKEKSKFKINDRAGILNGKANLKMVIKDIE